MKLLGANAAFAAAMVCLFSPGLLGLSPFAANAAAAAASIAVGVVAVPSFVMMNRALLAERKEELLEADEADAGI